MLTHISLVVALCAHLTTSAIQAKVSELESHNPGSKVTVRINQKATCDASGNVLEKKSRRE